MKFSYFLSRITLALGVLGCASVTNAQLGNPSTFSSAGQVGAEASLRNLPSTVNGAATAPNQARGVALTSKQARSNDPAGASEPMLTLPETGGANWKEEPPSQFQKFAQESTGTLLPIFGSQLFEFAQTYAPDAGLAAPANYVLGPGDEVQVQIWGAIDESASFVLDREGRIFIPKVGSLSLAGVTSTNLEPALKGHLSKVFTNFGLSATLGKLRSVQVYVVGQARRPGTYSVSSLSTLVNVLFASGGPSANGSMRSIELRRAGRVVTKLDLYDFIAKGDKSADMPVLPGDVVFIPPATRRVAVAGAYDQKAVYELKDATTTIGDVLALGGGASPVANSRKALLERVFADKTPPRQVVDIALDAKGLAQALVPGDILTLLPVSGAFSNAVTLQGVVTEPLRYSWFDGMRVSDLIPDRDALITQEYYRRMNGLTRIPSDTDTKGAGSREEKRGFDERVRNKNEQINWDYAVIERLSRTDLSVTLVPFNLAKAVVGRDPQHNLVLQPGDVLTIVSQRDMALPQEKQTRLVRLEGEVAAPGVYEALPGETLPQLIKRIGGLTPQAYLFGTEFSRESVRLRQQENLSSLVRRLEGELQSKVPTSSSASGQDAATLALVAQQQQAQLKSQIDRLKALKSNGRLALELDTAAQSLAGLPNLPLEDGDRVLVPSMPGFISAFGAVYNENAMIYKPGKTVGDVVRAAGTTEDAESSGAFVLRADGSVVSRRDSNRIFGSGFESLAVMPGDTLVVPAKLDRESVYAFTVRSLKDLTQIFANLGIGAAAIKTLRN
ncbi:Soluble ligand binding domain containing protein [Comamonadaceae bacterium]